MIVVKFFRRSVNRKPLKFHLCSVHRALGYGFYPRMAYKSVRVILELLFSGCLQKSPPVPIGILVCRVALWAKSNFQGYITLERADYNPALGNHASSRPILQRPHPPSPVSEMFEIFRAKRWWFGQKYSGENILKDKWWSRELTLKCKLKC